MTILMHQFEILKPVLSICCGHGLGPPLPSMLAGNWPPYHPKSTNLRWEKPDKEGYIALISERSWHTENFRHTDKVTLSIRIRDTRVPKRLAPTLTRRRLHCEQPLRDFLEPSCVIALQCSRVYNAVLLTLVSCFLEGFMLLPDVESSW